MTELPLTLEGEAAREVLVLRDIESGGGHLDGQEESIDTSARKLGHAGGWQESQTEADIGAASAEYTYSLYNENLLA